MHYQFRHPEPLGHEAAILVVASNESTLMSAGTVVVLEQ